MGLPLKLGAPEHSRLSVLTFGSIFVSRCSLVLMLANFLSDVEIASRYWRSRRETLSQSRSTRRSYPRT